MITISPGRFRKAFLKIVTPKDRQIRSLWDDYPKYTDMFIGLMPKIAAELALECYNGNYYTLDTIFYERKDTNHFGRNVTYAEFISISLEHENDSGGTAIEVNKLQILNTPLKVLVTYTSENEIPDLLSKYSDIIRRADIFDDFSTLRRQLVIIGTYGKKHTIWGFYSYNKGSFVQVHS